jgi:uncharacterized protein with LGFP repeats
VHDTRDDPDGAGTISRFEHGGISASAQGAFVILDPMWTSWRALSGLSGPLGYPSTDTVANNDGVGSHNDFAQGTVTTSPTTGTHAVWGPIFITWADDYGREAGSLGHPDSDVYAVDSTHDRCDFTGGSLVLDKQSGTVSQV